MCTLQQLSVGEITLKSNDPFDHPIIDPKSLSVKEDLQDLVEAVKKTRNIFNQSALAPFNGGEYNPGIDVDNDHKIEQWLRGNLETCYHPTCTGTDWKI